MGESRLPMPSAGTAGDVSLQLAAALIGNGTLPERLTRAIAAVGDAAGVGGIAIADTAGQILASRGALSGLTGDDPRVSTCIAARTTTAISDELLAMPVEADGRRQATVIACRGADIDTAPLGACVPILGLALALHTAETSRTQFRRHALRAQEEERARIARELHDGIGQALTALLVGLRTLESMLPDEAGCSPARDLARHLGATAINTLEEIGRLARGLRPRVLDDVGLAAALERHVAELNRTHEARTLLLVSGLRGERLPRALETTIYRLIQEALNNVAKHARATTASVIVERRGDEVLVIVEDDGRGMRARTGSDETPSSHLGMLGLRERVALFDGTVEIESTPGLGTTIYARLPLPRGGP